MTLTPFFVKREEVNSNDNSSVSGVSKSSINDEFLSGVGGLNDDVSNFNRDIGDLQGFPGKTFIPGVLDFLSGSLVVSNNDDASVVTDFINV